MKYSTLFLRVVVASALTTGMALAQTTPIVQNTPVSTLQSTVLLIPFGPPGNTDYQLDNATNDFSKRLSEKKGLNVILSKAMDAMDVAGSAAELCGANKATAIYAGTVRHEQNHNIMWGTFPTHAEVRVTELSCDGKVKWKGVGISDKVQYWSNPAAAVTNVIQNALDQIISEMP